MKKIKKKEIIAVLVIIIATISIGIFLFKYFKPEPAISQEIPKITLDETLRREIPLLTENNRVTDLSFESTIKINELPLATNIKEIDPKAIPEDNTNLESWLSCLKKDQSGKEFSRSEDDFKDTTQGLNNVIIPKALSIKAAAYGCGYSDRISFLRIFKDGNMVREFSYLLGGLRFQNTSPDRTKTIFTGVKDPDQGDFSRESFIYDFINDELTILPRVECVEDRYHWIDDTYFASIKLGAAGTYHPNSKSTICIFNDKGEIERGFESEITYHLAYPGGKVFQGDIDFFGENRLQIYNEMHDSRDSSTYCTILIEDSNKQFRTQRIVKTIADLPCGKISRYYFNSEKEEITETFNFYGPFVSWIFDKKE